jgi:RNA recognition motif-containing protein
MKNLYVGNIEKTTTEEDLKTAFAIYGPVEVVSIIKDQATGLPRGFGFVEMTEEKDALEAVQGLNGSLMAGRAINVSEARAKTNTGRSRASQ